MREDVCTVLNEREPLKQQMATALEEQLTARGLSNTRIEAVGDIAQVLIERQPRVVILDYVLGDVATALDIITALRSQLSHTQTQIIVWTDDPSVSVAVSAIKLGANDYVQLGLTVSLERVIQSIEHALTVVEEFSATTSRKKKGARGELVANAPSFQKLLQQATGVAGRNEQIVVLLGERGCGRNSVAKFVHEARMNVGQFFEIDYDLFQGSSVEIAGADSHRHVIPLLSHSATVYFDHLEFDDGELLEAVGNRREKLFLDHNDSEHPMLIIGTTSPETAEAWKRLLHTPVLTVPALSDRPDDFWPLLQLFASEVKSSGSSSRISISPPIARELARHSWPGNVRQLRAAVIEALSTPIIDAKNREDTGTSDLSKSDAAIVSHIQDAKLRWESESSAHPWVPTRLVAQAAMDRARGNPRVAAALLGTGVRQVQQAVQSGAEKV